MREIEEWLDSLLTTLIDSDLDAETKVKLEDLRKLLPKAIRRLRSSEHLRNYSQYSLS